MTGTPAARQLDFARRAAELGLPCWCADAHANVTHGPQAREALADEIRAVVQDACATVRPTRRTSVRADLFALPDEHGAVVADLSAVADADRAAWVGVLTHFHTDLARAAADALAIDGFNGQLSQAYEEVNLIFRMGKLLASSADPAQVVQSMCDELRGTLGYGWLAMAFRRDDAVLASLRGTLLHAGVLPAAPGDLNDAMATIDVAVTGRVITPAAHPLAGRCGSELLAEAVAHGDTPVGLLVAGNRQGDDPDVSSNEIQLVQAAANFLGLFHQNAFRFAEQRQQFLGTLHALSAAVDAKDPYTHGHSERVGLLASQLAARVGFDPATVDAVRVAGLLHDIGKIGVPEAVLRKPARLTDDEFALIKQHPDIGYGILRDLPSLTFHLPGVLHHHERYDGRGYPHGLCGDAIPLIARILALADTFDAMSSNRAYRAAMDRSRVLDEIRKSSGVQFDPQLVEPFVTMDFTAFDRMIEDGRAAAPASEAKAA